MIPDYCVLHLTFEDNLKLTSSLNISQTTLIHLIVQREFCLTSEDSGYLKEQRPHKLFQESKKASSLGSQAVELYIGQILN